MVAATAATFVEAMNRVDVVELVVDLVDVDLDVDLVDVDLAVSLCGVHVLFHFHLASWPRLVLFVFGSDENGF